MSQPEVVKNTRKNIAVNVSSNEGADPAKKLTFKEEWDSGISVEELRTNLLKKVHSRWNEKLALAKK